MKSIISCKKLRLKLKSNSRLAFIDGQSPLGTVHFFLDNYRPPIYYNVGRYIVKRKRRWIYVREFAAQRSDRGGVLHPFVFIFTLARLWNYAKYQGIE